jgi:FkbM family methyltransferase
MFTLVRKIRKLYSLFSFYGPFTAGKTLVRYVMYVCCKYAMRKKVLRRNVYDFKMYLSLVTGGISKSLYLYGHREDDHREIFARELKRNDRVLDIGANIGYYALMEAMYVGPGGKVFAVEPDRRNLELLRANIALNGMDDAISVYDIAISNENGMRDFGIHPKSNLNVILTKDTDTRNAEYASVIKVRTADIYEFLQGIGHVDLIRMDIEGHEVEVLEGIQRVSMTFPQLVPECILFEAHPIRYDDVRHNMSERLTGLFHAGYRVKTIVSSDERVSSVIKQRGYMPWRSVKSDMHERGLYDNIREKDALAFICDIGCVRTVLLSKGDSDRLRE